MMNTVTTFTSMLSVLAEVKQHDFYMAHYVDIVANTSNKTLMEKEIRRLADSVNLKVTFNHRAGVCIFELDV